MKASAGKLIVLAAGGTGGHLFPAQALGEELVRRGHHIHLMTDERVRDYGKSFPAEKVHIIHSATLTPSKPLQLPGQLLKLCLGYFKARGLLKSSAAAAVVGFGGYPSLPPMMAASHRGLPTVVHEQNSVLGRANRLLVRYATRVATSFSRVLNRPAGLEGKFVFTGNPVRSAVAAVAAAPFPPMERDGAAQILVFGGSQGAKVFADLVPPAIAAMAPDVRRRIHITQQCRPEDMDRTRVAYEAAGVSAELSPFFMDMPQRMARSHLVICRSGASSVAELGVVGRPAILVPLPHALDNDQLRNAESFSAAGAGWLLPQKDIDPQSFAALLTRLLSNEQGLKEAAQAALRQGKPQAARELADLVEKTMAAAGRS